MSALAMYENGARIPRDENKEKITRYYGKTVDEIFFLLEMSLIVIFIWRGEPHGKQKAQRTAGQDANYSILQHTATKAFPNGVSRTRPCAISTF